MVKRYFHAHEPRLWGVALLANYRNSSPTPSIGKARHDVCKLDEYFGRRITVKESRLPMDSTFNPPMRALEDLSFRGSTQATVGVEVELQVLDHQTGDLAPGAQRILGACLEENIEGVSGEFLLSMLELRTGVCDNVVQVRDTLVPLLQRVRHIAGSVGFDIGFGGTHPFGRPAMSAVSPSERYQRIQKRQAYMAYQEAVYGLHVHIGVPSGETAIGVINLLVPYLPHLLALSANSPFWQGIDTGFASARLRMFQPSGNAGLPPCLASWQEFVEYCQVLHGAKLIEATKDIYWDIRPRPGFGTIEFRIFDVPGRFSEMLGLVALVRAMVLDALHSLEKNPQLIRGDRQAHWLAAENRLLASRHGLQTQVIRAPGMERVTVVDDVARLMERLAPVIEKSEDCLLLRSLQDVDQLETGTERQRRTYRETGSWRAVLDEMIHGWVDELASARPRDQRTSEPGGLSAPLAESR
jgi:carboxylate-amine ligase